MKEHPRQRDDAASMASETAKAGAGKAADNAVFGLRVMLVVHAVAVVGLSILLWRLLSGLNELAAIGDTGESDPTGMNVVLALLLGPTPLLNPLAAVNLTRRPRRAKAYLAVAGTVAWLQEVASALIAVAFAFVGGFFLFLLVVPLGLLVFAWTRAARRDGAGSSVDAGGHRRGFWRATALPPGRCWAS